MNACPLAVPQLDCSSTGALELAPGGQVTDFSAADWNPTTGRICNAHGLVSGLFAYWGPSTAGAGSTVGVDPTARNLRLAVSLTETAFGGGGLMFQSCVDATAFNAIQFTAALAAGSFASCIWQLQLQTLDQRPNTQAPPGTCDPAAMSCYRHPAHPITTAPSATPATFTLPFSAFTNPSGSTIPGPTQIVGLQWQLDAPAGGACAVELRIDDIRFVTQ
jgi:hypothetical protein